MAGLAAMVLLFPIWVFLMGFGIRLLGFKPIKTLNSEAQKAKI